MVESRLPTNLSLRSTVHISVVESRLRTNLSARSTVYISMVELVLPTNLPWWSTVHILVVELVLPANLFVQSTVHISAGAKNYKAKRTQNNTILSYLTMDCKPISGSGLAWGDK